jgi:hypothetical protein
VVNNAGVTRDRSLTRMSAMDWDEVIAVHLIRVNALAPVARTDMTAVFDRGDVSHELAFPPPESVAPIVVHLASDAARHLHGQILAFDGTQLSVWSHPEPTSTWARPDGWTHDAFGDALTTDVMQYPHPTAGARGSAADRRRGPLRPRVPVMPGVGVVAAAGDVADGGQGAAAGFSRNTGW